MTKEQIEKMLGLDPWTFDQDKNTGWRSLKNKDAIETINEYLKRYVTSNGVFKPNTPKNKRYRNFDSKNLYWHLGQIYAFENNYTKAKMYMEKSRNKDKYNKDQEWNLYVNATIAFLAKNRKKFDEYASQIKIQNKDVVERLGKKFNYPYKIAY